MRQDLSDIREMNANVGTAAQQLASTHPDIMLYGCTGGSFFAGDEYNRDLAAEISSITDAPAITTTGAVTVALRRLGIERLGLITPYADALNLAEKKFLEHNAFSVAFVDGLGRYSDYDAGTEQDTFEHALSATRNFAGALDGIFISCTNYPSLGIISRLEQELDLPVVTSNLASIWYTLRQANIANRLGGYGRLLERF
jgi:maleate isomerase